MLRKNDLHQNKADKDKLNKEIRQQISEDVKKAKNLFMKLAPNCFKGL